VTLSELRGGVALMDNTMTTTGAVEMTGVFARPWSECPQPLTRHLADTSGPVQGSTLPTSAPRHDGPAAGMRGGKASTGTIARTIAPTYLDVRPFRSGRPPV
jgi:hypothetical protein